jgi:hypothetical protein
MCEGVACAIAASTEWGDRAAMVRPDPAEALEQARFTAELYAMAGLCLVACIPLVIRRSIWSWWLALAIQVGIFVFAIVEGFRTDPIGWIGFSSLPLLATLLLIVVRVAQVRQWDAPAVAQLRESSS